MKNEHITSDVSLAREELDLQDRELACLACGLEAVSSWKEEGPVAPAVSDALLRSVRRRQQREWMSYAYKVAAGFVVLVLFFQLGNYHDSSATDAPKEAAHFLVDSARNDTAFLLKDDLSEDTVKAVSLFEEVEKYEEVECSETSGNVGHFSSAKESSERPAGTILKFSDYDYLGNSGSGIQGAEISGFRQSDPYVMLVA